MEIRDLPTAREFIRAWRSEPNMVRRIRALRMASESQRVCAGLIPETIVMRRSSPAQRKHTAASMVLLREACRLAEGGAS